MIKQFCDGCGTEIVNRIGAESDYNYVSSRYKRQLEFAHITDSDTTKINIEVFVAVDHAWNAGHVCGLCLKKVFLEGDECGHGVIEHDRAGSAMDKNNGA